MKLTIHIGSHKAGSTAIQNTCSRESSALKAAGVYYPENLFPNFPSQHSELATLTESGDPDEVKSLFRRIAEEAKTNELSHVFLSGEDLCSAVTPNGLDRLADALTGKFDTVNIVLVLRRKYDYLLSHLNHYLRHQTNPIRLADFRDSLRFSPRDTIERWSDAFGASAVKAFPYDSPPSGKSFLDRFFSEILTITLTEKAVEASANANASYDLLSAIVVNEALKTLPNFNIADVNLAYLDSFKLHRGRMPLFEADVAERLDELFHNEEWAVEGLPDLTSQRMPPRPLEPDDAQNYLHSLATFFSTLRALYCSDAPDSPLGRGDIVSSYRAFLGRVPSHDELERVTRGRKTMPTLRQMIVDSPEFRRVHREKLNTAGLDLPPLDVTVQASEAEQQAMFAHLQARWSKLGTDKKHWSVLSRPEFEDNVTVELEEEFYRTGANELRAVQQTLARAGRSLSNIRRLVDFGCGLGRFTLNAATEVPEVVGIDFSAGHLQDARVAAARMNVDNVEWVKREGLEALDVGAYDAWYSRIVLQHNPPPLIARWLREGLGGLSSGGVAIFQVPTYSVNYSFSPEEYLEDLNDKPDVEMHCLPQGEILRIVDEMSCRLLEVREDNAVDIPRYWVSNTFVLERLSGDV